jgi:hypothetical protein
MDARTGGFTRLNISTAVPGRNGSWNVDAYGRLSREFLTITRTQAARVGLATKITRTRAGYSLNGKMTVRDEIPPFPESASGGQSLRSSQATF